MKKQLVSGVVALSLLLMAVPSLAANDADNQSPKTQPEKRTRTFGPFVGVVQTVEGDTITTSGKTLGKRTIITTPDTDMREGDNKIELSAITKGSLIRVTGTSTDKTNKTITAKKITLIKKAGAKTKKK